MPEPIHSAAAGATLAVAGATLPVLQAAAHAAPTLELLGVPLGLRADVLMAGFFGSLVAMALLNTVPATGDTWRELLRTSLRRMMVALASSATAGYTTPLMLLVDHIPDGLLLSAAFVVGVFAQKQLARLAPHGVVGDQGKEEGPRA
jgi:hypothetical protein